MKTEDDVIDAMYNAINVAKDKPRVSGDPTEEGPVLVSYL